MNAIDAIIKARGGYEHLRDNPIRLEVQGFMPLSVEVIGTGPRTGVMIAVHHTKEVNGDLCFDPEVVFEVWPEKGLWCPLSFEMSGIIYQEVVFTDPKTDELVVRQELLDDIEDFCRLWNSNIADQGFIDKARE